jgi:hypothetical protein
MLDSHEAFLDLLNSTFLVVKFRKEDCLDHGVDNETIAPIMELIEKLAESELTLHISTWLKCIEAL